MEGDTGSTVTRRGSRKGLLWGVIIAVVVLASAGVATLLLWPNGERVSVPDLVGMQQAEAKDALAEVGLDLGDIDRVTVDAATTVPDTVVSQLPLAGTEVNSGAEVALVVAADSSGTSDDEAGAPSAS